MVALCLPTHPVVTDSKVARRVQAAAANPAICPTLAQVQDLLRASKADWTKTSYLAIITRFVVWRDAMLDGDGSLDGPMAVALFLAKEHACTSGKTKVARSALAWYFDLIGCQANLARDLIPVAISQGSLRRDPPVVHHDKVTADEIKLIFQSFTGPNLPLSDHRISTVLTLMFSAFLQVLEVVALKRSDVKFDSSHVWLNIQKSKTDQLGRMEHQPVARLGGGAFWHGIKFRKVVGQSAAGHILLPVPQHGPVHGDKANVSRSGESRAPPHTPGLWDYLLPHASLFLQRCRDASN
uniref:Tyr recombinase domain-containing protein n=1 Tax=Plectus sambesii TaxID=2011161 RepID=A0A914X7C8_9BILA